MPGKRVRSDFTPAPWLTNPHLQTLWPALLRKFPEVTYRNERLELPDGDFVDLCWTPGTDEGPIVVVIHGLEGSIRSHYAAGIMAAIHQRGWRGVFLHFRGCSGTPNRLDRAYHSGETGDIGFLVQTLVERYPGTPIATIGYSLGGNAMLKYLGTTAAPVTAAVAVSVPYVLHDSAKRLSRGLSRLYQRHLVASLKAKIRLKFNGRPTPLPLDTLDAMHTFHEFDDAITAPMHGFAGVDDYYTQSSSRQYLGGIRIPALLIHALDDPFMTPATLPQADELADNVILEVADHGGHVGFISGQYPWKPVYWLEPRIIDYLNGYLN